MIGSYGQLCGVNVEKLSFDTKEMEVPEYVMEATEPKEIMELSPEEEEEDLQKVISSLVNEDESAISKVSTMPPPPSVHSGTSSLLSFCTNFNIQTFSKTHIEPISSIITTRSAEAPTTTSLHPLTSRSVERIFSFWRRKMDSSSSYKPITIQMCMFLQKFEIAELQEIISTPDTPFTKWFVQYLLKCDNKKELRKQVCTILFYLFILVLILIIFCRYINADTVRHWKIGPKCYCTTSCRTFEAL